MLTFSRYSIFDFAIFHYAERLSSGAGGGISNQLGAEPISWNNLKKNARARQSLATTCYAIIAS
tara:strand:- start:63 stop:254 length:192 start_codon:yes stop_codon:yes gene_type:complete